MSGQYAEQQKGDVEHTTAVPSELGASAMACGTQRNRPTPEGRKLGDQVARLTEKCVAKLALEGEEDERCASCAYRRGTFPNGCPETIMDALKCTMENVPFFCHAPHDGRICFGWYASRWGMNGKVATMPYEFSAPALGKAQVLAENE